MRKVPKRKGKRAVVVLCALLATSACTQQVKKSVPPPQLPPSSEPQASAPPVTPPTFNGPLRLHEVRVIESLGQHSVLFRLSRPPEGIDYFPLRNPSRLVIDIKGAIEPLQQVQHYKAADPLIAAVRVGNYQGRMRLVVDLKGGEPPSFSVDNYDTLITAFIGEKNEKANGKAHAESNAQVLFLADDVKEASRTQIASVTHQPTSAASTEKTPLPSEPATVNGSIDSSQNKPEASVAVKESQQQNQPKEPLTLASQASPTASTPTPVTTTTTSTSSANGVQEEILAPTPSPTQFEANLTETSLPTEEEPWEVKRITQAPASTAQKARRTGQKGAEDALLLAREDSAPSAVEFRTDQALQYTGKKISLDFKNADIHDVLRIVAEVSGLNIVATDDVRARVTLRLVEVPWDQALDVVLQANGLEKSQTGNVITVSTTKRLEAERNARLAAQNAQQKLTPLATEYLKVNYVKATDVAALISRETQQRTATAGAGTSAAPRASAAAGGAAGGGGRGQQVALMSPRGTIAADSTTNVLILRDLPENIAAVRELVRNVDVQTPQVVIESYLVTTSENLNRALGIQWGYSYKAGPETGNPTGVNFPGRIGLGGSGLNTGTGNVPFIADFPAAGVAPGSGAALDLLLGSLDGSQTLAVRLSALEQQGKVRVISRPRVVTINNKAADIRSRRVVRVPIISGSLNVGGAGSTQGGGNAFQEFDVGITLKVTPQISSDGFVLLDIDAETSDLAPASVRPTGSGSSFPLIPDTLTRTASSNVLIHAGDTFVLGGILQDLIDQSEAGIPYLRDTPGLGWLFRGRSNNRVKSELLVFITPKLVAGVSTAALPTAQQLWESRPKDNSPQEAAQQQ
jgi:type IV pilus assembly protein PilQ